MSDYKRVKLACYTANLSMSVISNISPVLFITFRMIYGVSYSLLGLLVLINFCTQLTVDLLFSFFSDKFNIEKSVKLTPVLCFIGLLIYALSPLLFPQHAYLGLVIGTVVFSASGGLGEVLISPVIAAIPSENPDREMSKLHSVYAWGVVFVIIIATLFIMVCGAQKWYCLVFLLMLVPFLSSILFFKAKLPDMKPEGKGLSIKKLLSDKSMLMCILLIFLGGASECTMAQWASGFIEKALGIPKAAGDIFGVAAFSLMLGLGRTLYSKNGKNAIKIIFLGFIGAAVCYFTAALTLNPIIGLIACAVTGFCVSMLWPGSLIVASDYRPDGGVIMYALMAAGGDLGASVTPQLVGIITDLSMKNPGILHIAANLGLQPEQAGMKLGILAGGLFPLVAIFVSFKILKKGEKR
ncbi:MAG: MFS transporter [Ruminococcaceae bacterium]|nr:MFS transporter [Oscillospiraceae bacterium]